MVVAGCDRVSDMVLYGIRYSVIWCYWVSDALRKLRHINSKNCIWCSMALYGVGWYI